jgi:transposase
MAVKKKLIDITDQEIEAIYDAGKEVTVNFIMTLVDKINAIAEIVEKQQEEINYLKNIISKDSHNSNKPPSSDNPYKKQTRSLRKKGGKSGGQKGHKGTNLKRVENPDIITKIRVNGNCECKRKLTSGKLLGYENKQVIDLPTIKTVTTEYKAEIRECMCGKIHIARFPSEAQIKVQYGSNIKSLVVYLKHYGFMSYERISEFMKDVAGQRISQGTLVNMINECAGKLRPTVDKIKETLINESVVHFDETGIRIESTLHWLHSAGNKNFTYYFPHKKRGKQAMDDMGILPCFQGIAVHDHWDSYYQFIQCIHSLCNSHHLRELLFFEEQNEKWAAKIKQCLLDAKKEKDKKKRLPKKRKEFYRRKMYRLLNEGLKIHPEEKRRVKKRGRPKQSKAHNLLSRMKRGIDDVLRFICNPVVPFDNNLSERDIRMAKVQQKVSGTFRSFKGAINFCIIRSYISTARKQGISVFKAICAGLQNCVVLSF